MTIQLSKELAASIESLVQAGRYASIDEAMNEAARLLLHQADPRPRMTDAELDRLLIEQGLMLQAPDLDSFSDDPDDVPIEIEGEPLSETIIRERR